jgi:IS30 family transposase
MEQQVKCTTHRLKWQQLDYKKRLKIEVLYKSGKSSKQIAVALGYSVRTIQRELARGTVTVKRVKPDVYAAIVPTTREYNVFTEYSADAAQKLHDELASYKGKQLKIGNNHAFAEYIEEKIIKEKLSPYAALQRAKQENKPFAGLVSVKTLYNYIDANLFLNLTNKHLWVKRNPKKRDYGHVRPAYNNLKGRSIDERPAEVLGRQEYGHWEFDTLVGKGKVCLLVMTERKTREQLVRKLKSRSQLEVANALDKLERRFGAEGFRRKFKSITVDNGGEFLNQSLIEESVFSKDKLRTTVYYCHPYCAWERGSNENANKFIRRFIPKGTSLADYSESEIRRIENYINNYPRKLFAGYPANSLYQTA